MNENGAQSNLLESSIERYSDTVVKTAYSYLKSRADAEDIAQEVFLTLYQSDVIFITEEHRKAWLIRVTINKCKNYLKSRWFRDREELTEDLPYIPEEQSEVLNAVFSLNTKYRLPVHLYYYEGYSIKEIGQILDMSAATVGTRLARGRRMLKKIVGGGFDERQ